MNRDKTEKTVVIVYHLLGFFVFRNVYDLNILMKIKTKWILS